MGAAKKNHNLHFYFFSPLKPAFIPFYSSPHPLYPLSFTYPIFVKQLKSGRDYEKGQEEGGNIH